MKRLIATLAAAVMLSACTQIDTGNIGVESSMGQVKKETLIPGVYWTFFKKVTEVSAKELPLALDDLRPQTSDKITLNDLDVDIYVQIDPARAADIMTRWPGDVQEVKGEDGVRVGLNYVTRQAREAIYGAVATHGSSTVHTERADLASEIVKALQKDLNASAGDGWFFVRSANIRSLVTDPALQGNITAAAAAKFKVQEKDQLIEVAKKEADRLRVEAQGEADAARIRADGLRTSQGGEYLRMLEIQNQAEAIKKWDGTLPTTNAGGAVPFLNLK